MRRAPIILVLFFSTLVVHAQNNRNRGYVFTAPKKLIAGETENVCLSLHNLEPPVHINIDLLANTAGIGPPVNDTSAYPEDDVLASVKSTLKTGIESCLELRVASGTKFTSGNLRLRLKFDKHPDYVVDTQKRVYIEHDALVTFVETDKPVYKPDQDVNIRVLNLKHDLKPWTKSIPKIWIENPSEIRVAQWSNITTENGMAQLSFPLSHEPSFGIWKIKVEKTRPQLVHTASFEVKKYVLPRFQVTIGAPSYILADAKFVNWKICARYTYGEPVKGTLRLNIRPQTPIWRRQKTKADINDETDRHEWSADGCTDYKLAADMLGLPQWKIAPNNIVLFANFTEAKTGRVETAKSRTPVVHQPLKLEFTPHTPKFFKPGLPYHGKLRVLHPDGSKPAPNEKIQVCLRIRRKDEWQRSVVECKNFTSSNAEGFLDFIVPPQMKNIVLLSFVATAVDYPTKYYSPDKRWRVFVDQPSAYIDVEPWYSASSSFLSVSQGYLPITCDEKYSFNVMFTSGTNNEEASDKPIIFHYSINSKGDMLIFGHVKYKPRKDTIIDYSEFPNLLGANSNASASGDSAVHRFPLSVKITPSMAPVSELLLYYVRPDGEIVSSSHTVKVSPCFENQVKTVWHEEKMSPGSQAKLHIEASPSSLCGLSAVDKSTRFLTASTAAPSSHLESNLVDIESVFARLRSFHLKPDASPIQSVWSHCEKPSTIDELGDNDEPEEIDHLPPAMAAAALPARRKRHSVTYNAAANYVDAIQAFDDFGTVVMSDLILESRPCPPWRSSVYDRGIGSAIQEDADEPDRMLKSVKAMPLAFQFNAPGSSVIDAGMNGQDISYNDPALLESTANVVRSFFPETWIWKLVPTGKEGKTSLDFKLPDSITTWVGNTICVSSKDGLGISKPVEITAFQPFFLDVDLPYSAKRGEKLQLKVSLFNYMTHSLPVAVKLIGNDGLNLLETSSEVTNCLGPKDSAVHEFILEPKLIGPQNITVIAEIVDSSQIECGPEVILYTRDEIIKPLLVKAEGYPVEVTKSAFLCPKDFNEDLNLAWDLDLPVDLIEGSARASISVVGDVLGPVLENLDQLVKLPMGCGEQNMILFVPNIHAINYLDAINRQTGSEMRAQALKNMQKGYQRELNYRHPDGSYSAFGSQDEAGSGSMWLTAFVVKSFAQARSLIPIDERDLKMSVKWILRRQLENGCFPVVGQVFHKDMKGGLRDEDGSSSALTAYVLIALLESGVPLAATMVNNALYCLEKASASDNLQENPYTSALSTYALALLEHPRANESLRHLLTRASRQNDLVWWEDKSKPDSLSLSIEMTSYAVLSLVKLGGENNTMEALRAVRWMSKKRNAEGGFSSTQDTVIGLEALTKYALAMANASTTELSVLITANGLERMFDIKDENRMVLSNIELPSLPTRVEIFAEGGGCVLVQSSLKYNKPNASGSEAFDLTVSVENVETSFPGLEPANPDAGCSKQRMTICSRYKLPDEESNMVVLEVGIPNGFTPDRDTLNDLLYEHSTGVKRYEDNQDTLAIYFDKLTSQKTCISFQVERSNMLGGSQPGIIKVYDYYQPELTLSTDFKFLEYQTCDNKSIVPIAHQEPSKLVDENIQQNDEIFEIREKKIDLPPLKQRSVSNIEIVQSPADEGSGIDEVDDIFSSSPMLPNKILANNNVKLVDDNFGTTFFNVDHEMATPGGIEGPATEFLDLHGLLPQLFTSKPITTKPHYTTMKNDLQQEVPIINVTSLCPRCEDKIPLDIEQLICAARNVVKVAIRRSRKARMLLDLSPSKPTERLHSTVELSLNSECYCGPVDKPGNMALLLNWKEARDYSKVKDKTKASLDENSSIFTLPPINGVPPIIEKARYSCARSHSTIIMSN